MLHSILLATLSYIKCRDKVILTHIPITFSCFSAPQPKRRIPPQSPPYTGLRLGGYEQHQKNLKAQAAQEYQQYLQKQVSVLLRVNYVFSTYYITYFDRL